MQIPGIDELFLWGIPLLGLVDAIVQFVEWVVGELDEKIRRILGGVLIACGAMLIFALPDLLELYPWLDTWGKYIIWSITIGLMYMGFFPMVRRFKRVVETVIARIEK